MYFTREPVIETVIAGRDGYKLAVRKRGVTIEEFIVEVVQIVSFGSACFFRSLEGVQFLLPVADYEILEVKATRESLRSISQERKHAVEKNVHRAKPVAPPLSLSIEELAPKSKEPEEQEARGEEPPPPLVSSSTVESARNGKENGFYKERDQRKRRATHRRSNVRPSEEVSTGSASVASTNEVVVPQPLEPRHKGPLPPPPMLVTSNVAKVVEDGNGSKNSGALLEISTPTEVPSMPAAIIPSENAAAPVTTTPSLASFFSFLKGSD